MSQVAPPCAWIQFREWSLVLMSCELNAKNQELLAQGYHLGAIVRELYTLVGFASGAEFVSNSKVDSFEIYELINWMQEIHYHLYPLYKPHLPMRTHLHGKKVIEAISTAQKYGICLHRFWNLAVGSAEREEVDLPVLMTMVEHNPVLFSQHRLPGKHDTCSPELCHYSNIDNTRIQQLHKCSALDCGKPLYFPLSELEKPYQTFTWWVNNVNGVGKLPYVVGEEEVRPYLAISHVWADGTGGGTRGQNMVNRCLWEYWAEIAQFLGCSAIWWDTICIPAERKARQKAISRMDQNFIHAAHTVIHDEWLVDFPWAENGSPCLALLLSPWFTRAWTALELMRSRKDRVWVIFRHPTGANRYTVKNLEREVLAAHPALSSRGHWVASSLVLQLRDQQFNCIEDLQKVLKTKSTSWPRDIMIVASLFTGHDPNISIPGYISHITREIVLGFVTIEESFLYHGHTTMAQRGPFSWCPSNLMDGPISTNVDEPVMIYIGEDGTATGTWLAQWLTSEEEAKKVQPYSHHVSVDWQIRMALNQWEHCLLLQTRRQTNIRALLVTSVDLGYFEFSEENYNVLEAHFVGAVYTDLDWGFNRLGIPIRLGKHTKDPTLHAKDLVAEYLDRKGPIFLENMFAKHVERIKEARRKSKQSGSKQT